MSLTQFFKQLFNTTCLCCFIIYYHFMNEDIKKISIQGINNRYQIKKMVNEPNKYKKRIDTSKWCFSINEMSYENQLILLNEIFILVLKIGKDKFLENEKMKIKKIIIQQIDNKILGYKQQDINKNRLDELSLITFNDVITKMVEVHLTCFYCKQHIFVLYDLSREKKQWTIDRIDNNLGHNKNNFYLACLECNLKRRRQNADRFLFTKQLNIIKQDT